MRRIYPATRVDPPPACLCHGTPMIWKTETSRKHGGRWRCYVDHKLRSALFHHTSKGRIAYGRRRYLARERQLEVVRTEASAPSQPHK